MEKVLLKVQVSLSIWHRTSEIWLRAALIFFLRFRHCSSADMSLAEVSVAEVLELRASDSLAELEVWNLLRGLLLAHTQGKSHWQPI